MQPAVMVTCPHCKAEVPMRGGTCKACHGSMTFKDFRGQFAEIMWCERLYNLKDTRPEEVSCRL